MHNRFVWFTLNCTLSKGYTGLLLIFWTVAPAPDLSMFVLCCKTM